MKSQIIFLGTAGDAMVAGRQERASGGIVIQAQELQFHIDPGPGALTLSKHFGVHVRETVGVLLTSSNWLQSTEINSLVAAMTYEGMDKIGILIANKTSFNGSEEKTAVITKETKSYLEKSIGLESSARIGINDVEIKTLYARQSKERPIGIKFTTPEFTMSYTGVTELNNLVVDAHKGSKLLIIHCKNPFGISERGFMNSEDVVKLLNKTKPTLAIITGFGTKMLNADPLYEAREIQKKSGVQVISARDGMAIDPVSYNATLRQNTLSLYK